jgi:Family of unknown function (DUF5316)
LKFLTIGIMISVISAIVSYFMWDAAHAYQLPGVAGVAFIILSAIFSGNLVSGDRMRANFATETEDTRRDRHQSMVHFALLGLPSLVVAVFLYYLFH